MKTTISRPRFITLSCALFTILSALSLYVLSQGTQSRPSADLTIRNAKIWTVDKASPTAQAVAILRDRIVAVGSNEEIESWRGASTRVIDASGKLLLPGFNDSHVH